MMTYHLGNIYRPDCPPTIDNESGEEVTAVLSDNEALVMAMLTDGLTEREIAAQLGKSPNTVRNQITSARKKTDTNSSLQLVLWLINQRLQEVYQTTICKLITIDGG